MSLYRVGFNLVRLVLVSGHQRLVPLSVRHFNSHSLAPKSVSKFKPQFIMGGIISSDAAYWIKKSKEIADHNLTDFGGVMDDVISAKSNDKLIKELDYVERQLKDADANNHKLVPRVVGIINRINGLVEGNPNAVKRVTLKSFIYMIDGVRDNKSYYLLDGIYNWIQERIPILQKVEENPVVRQLILDLILIKDESGKVRDSLDNRAQEYVKGVKEIHKLTGDVAGNLAQIQKIAKDMIGDPNWEKEFLSQSEQLVQRTNEIVKKYASK
ncbi:hypothetical protein HDE_07648 [Halotydeus destructor]|nr:hypothetical protein HDE_07648 [Halotydeus destructor]